MKIFTIRNEKLGFCNRPIYCETETEALSYIQNVLMSDADRALRGLRGDLALYLQGDINFETGEIVPVVPIVKICDLADIFDSIPADSIPRDSKELWNGIANLGARIDTLTETLDRIKEDVSKCKRKK